MSSHSIFYPMAALVALTVGVVTWAGVLRAVAVSRGDVAEDFYRLFQGDDRARPPLEAKLTRHYANLLELPVFYYVAGLAIFASGLVDGTFVALFWIFVAIRVLHAIVHATWNRPIHRGAVFGSGVVVLAAIWIRFLILLGRADGAV